jgi:hypothetical protein
MSTASHLDRENIVPFYALAPEAIPRLDSLKQHTKGYARSTLAAIFTEVSIPETIDELGAALAAIEISPSCAEPTASNMDLTANAATHDAYFRIVRVADNAPQVLVRSVLQANLIFLEEVSQAGTALTSSELQHLGSALAGLAFYIAGDTKGIPNSVNYSHWAAPGAPKVEPMRRWVCSHQLFAMLTQGMILALQEMTGALQDTRDADAAAALDLITVLLQGASIAFQFAADFPPGRYQDSVRPSMAPPFTSEGFSGILSADHRHLVKLLHLFRPQFEAAQNGCPGHYKRFIEAFGAMYDSHKHVCSRFVGTERSSLLMSAKNCPPAVHQLEQFKQMRIRNIQWRARRPECPFESVATDRIGVVSGPDEADSDQGAS